ncbi:MAG: hypothetical protein ACUVQ6_01225 [Dissulfurimicrobium sp.]
MDVRGTEPKHAQGEGHEKPDIQSINYFAEVTLMLEDAGVVNIFRA